MSLEIATIEFPTTVPYLLWAGGLFLLMYSIMVKVGAHLNRDSQEQIAFWMSGLYDDSWARQYRLFFEWLFGPRHFSIRCFIASAVMSILVVSAIYILLNDVLQLIGSRTTDRTTWFRTLGLGLVLNLLPDFFSLWKTRIIIKRMQRSPSAPMSLAFLFGDFLLSAAISVGFISIFLLVWKGESVPILEMVALFSTYSIFFYSTFATSIWSVLYFLSVLVMRLTSRTGLFRILAVEEKPVRTLAAICSTLLFVTLLAIRPMIEADSDGSSTFDRWICQLDPGICQNVIRITKDDENAVAHLLNACRTQDGERCKAAAQSFEQGALPRVYQLWAGACRAKDPIACNNMAVFIDKGFVPPERNTDIAAAYRESCEDGYAVACTNYGIKVLETEATEASRMRAILYFQRGCTGDDARGCSNAAANMLVGNPDATIATAAAVLADKACQLDEPQGCYSMGWITMSGLASGVPDVPGALEHFANACKRRALNACIALGTLATGNLGMTGAPEAALNGFASACDLADADGCNRAAWIYLEGPPTLQSGADAVETFKRACSLDHREACGTLGVLYETGHLVERSLENAENHYRKACDSGSEQDCADLRRLRQTFRAQ